NGDGISGRLADAAARVFARSHGPLIIVWPDLPKLTPEHAQGALDDLSSGCDVVLGPAIDGGLYMVAIGRPLPKLFNLPEQACRRLLSKRREDIRWRRKNFRRGCGPQAGAMSMASHGVKPGSGLRRKPVEASVCLVRRASGVASSTPLASPPTIPDGPSRMRA